MNKPFAISHKLLAICLFAFSFWLLTAQPTHAVGDVNWIAVGQGAVNNIASSSDGITWSGQGKPVFSVRGQAVAWNGTRWVAVGAGTNTIAYSSDGNTWTGVGTSIFSSSGYGVAWNGTRFVAVGQGTNTLAYSDDGITWTGLGNSIFPTSGRSVAWNGTRFVAVGVGTNTIAYSSDGITWTGLGNSIFAFVGYGIAWNGNRWVAVGSGDNSIAYSSDGITWTGEGTSTFSDYGLGVAWNGARWVAVGGGVDAIAYSTDGIIWTGLGHSIFDGDGNAVAWNGTRFVAVGTATNTIAYSSDGISWTGIGNSIFSSFGYGAAAKDTVLPTLTSVTISSDNADPTTAVAGDTVTLAFTSSEIINTPSVTFTSGGVAVSGSVTVTHIPNSNNWTATYTASANDTVGVVAYTISNIEDLVGNAGTNVTPNGPIHLLKTYGTSNTNWISLPYNWTDGTKTSQGVCVDVGGVSQVGYQDETTDNFISWVCGGRGSPFTITTLGSAIFVKVFAATTWTPSGVTSTNGPITLTKNGGGANWISLPRAWSDGTKTSEDICNEIPEATDMFLFDETTDTLEGWTCDGFGDPFTIPLGAAIKVIVTSATTWTPTLDSIVTFQATAATGGGGGSNNGSVTISKVVIGGSLSVGDFHIFLGNEEVTSGTTYTRQAGSYVISETPTTGYIGRFSGDCDTNGNIQLIAHLTKNCTLTNTYSASASPTPTPLVTPLPTSPSTPPNISTVTPAQFGLSDNDIISSNDPNLPADQAGDPDIYQINQYGYKRLFLNPTIFNFYNFPWNTVKDVSATTKNSFITSNLYRNCAAGDQKVYALEVTGEDTGVLHWINMSGDAAVVADPNFFKKVFCINQSEFNWYPKSTDYTSLSQITIYMR